MSNDKKLEIIIINYNSLFWIEKALTSLYKHYIPYSKYNVTVTIVDNASTDNSVQMIENKYPQIKIIKSSKNLGFSAGNNLALKKSTADYVMLLNPDTELTEKSKNIDTLIDMLEKDKKIGIITPKIVSGEGELDKGCHRGKTSLFDGLLYFCGFEKIFPKIKFFTQYHLLYKDLNTIHTVDAVSGACFITKLKYFKDVGFFDERYFMYSEDMDLCMTYGQKGYEIMYNPTVEIIHYKYKSEMKNKKNRRKYLYNSFLVYYDKWYRDKFYYRILRPFIFIFLKTAGIF